MPNEIETGERELLIHDNFRYEGIEYEISIWHLGRWDENEFKPEKYAGSVGAHTGEDVPVGMQQRFDLEVPLEERDEGGIPLGQVEEDITELEPEMTPAEMAESLLADLAQEWENYNVQSLEEAGVEVPESTADVDMFLP